MANTRSILACGDCGHEVGRWVGRCPACGAWGTVGERVGPGMASRVAPLGEGIGADGAIERRVSTGSDAVDRVLGGGLVPATVALLAGEPGIGKSTLLLQLVANLSTAGLPCLLASGEESRQQVALRARRLGLDADAIAFVSGRELGVVLDAATATRPFLLGVDSIQTLRDPAGGQVAGGTSQVRSCADALIGFAKTLGVSVLMTGHVTKDGDLAGPRALEHAVDVVLTFDGDPRSGLRMLAGGKNRFGPEGEVAWFEMGPAGLTEIDASGVLRSGDGQPGAAIALPRAGRRALAVEVQALVVPGEGPARRQAAGLDPRRFQLVAAVVDRIGGVPLGRAEVYGAAAGGLRIDDPACDLAVAAALASAASGVAPPPATAFVGELSLTGIVRQAPGAEQRMAAAKAGGVRTVVAAKGSACPLGVRIHPVRHLADALWWAFGGPSGAPETPGRRRAGRAQASGNAL